MLAIRSTSNGLTESELNELRDLQAIARTLGFSVTGFLLNPDSMYADLEVALIATRIRQLRSKSYGNNLGLGWSKS